jgi:hypothetical protein
MSNDNYKGFALFNDIEDVVLRTRNRGVVLANMAIDNMRDQKLSPKGVLLVLGYFNTIPEKERINVQASFVESMNQRGFQIS